MIELFADVPLKARREAVLFAFDDRSWPFVRGGRIVMENPRKRTEPVLRRGNRGDPDEICARVGGTVLRDQGVYRMWYSGYAPFDPAFGGTPEGSHVSRFIMYAQSKDGITWEKPRLNLVEFHGSSANNIVLFAHNGASVWVIIDEEAQSDGRYKMAIEAFGPDSHFDPPWQGRREGLTYLFRSPDGIRWKPTDGEGLRSPLSSWFETSTLFKFQGFYHVGGQEYFDSLPTRDGAQPGATVRTMVVARSADFASWPEGVSRQVFFPTATGNSGRPFDGRSFHSGISVTSRENVCIGMFGAWFDPNAMSGRSYIADEIRCDLGFALSNDGIHFREPAPGHLWMRHDIEDGWEPGLRKKEKEGVFLFNSQGIVEAGEETRIYYGASTMGGNTALRNSHVGLATLPRDRFGRLEQIDGFTDVVAFSCPFVAGSPTALYVNCDGVSAEHPMSAALWDDRRAATVPGFSHQDCVPVTVSGYRVPILWKGVRDLPLHSRCIFELRYARPCRFYAVYLSAVSPSIG